MNLLSTPGIRVGAQQVAPYRAALVADIGGDKQLPIIETSDNIPKIKLIGKYAVAGTPEECRKRIQEYIDAGAQTVILPSACPTNYIDENTRLIGEEIIPAFR